MTGILGITTPICSRALPSAQLNHESDRGPFLPIERQVDEGRDAHQVEASGRDVTARDSDRLDGLVDGVSADRMNLYPALTPAMAPATRTGLEVAPTFSTTLAALPSTVIVRILVKYVLVRWLDRVGRGTARAGLRPV